MKKCLLEWRVPSQRDDEEDAKTAFGSRVTHKRVRAMRKECAPPESAAPGVEDRRWVTLKPEPLQAALQRNDLVASQRPERAVATPRAFRCLCHCVRRRDAFALQLRDRAGHAARKGVGPRLNGRAAMPASFLR